MCEKCLYRQNCQFLGKHKKADVSGCTAFVSEAGYKSEAIKEFAEKVKDIVDEPALIRGRVIDTIIARIDDLVKEMTEEAP